MSSSVVLWASATGAPAIERAPTAALAIPNVLIKERRFGDAETRSSISEFFIVILVHVVDSSWEVDSSLISNSQRLKIWREETWLCAGSWSTKMQSASDWAFVQNSQRANLDRALIESLYDTEVAFRTIVESRARVRI